MNVVTIFWVHQDWSCTRHSTGELEQVSESDYCKSSPAQASYREAQAPEKHHLSNESKLLPINVQALLPKTNPFNLKGFVYF